MSLILFLFGSCWCSFLTTISWRKLFDCHHLFAKYSVCECCHNRIDWFYLIPIIGYLIQGGKCTQCRQAINVFWPIAEVINAILWMHFPIFSYSDAVIFLIVDSCMIITCTQDWFKQEFNVLWLISIGLLHWLTISEPFKTPTIGYIMIWLLGYYHPKIGNGDVDFIIIVALSCGPVITNQAVFYACLFSFFHPKLFRNASIPFLPFLWCGVLISLIIKKHALI